MTDQTLQLIEASRRVLRREISVSAVGSPEDLVHAIVELAGGRPNVIDLSRIDEGDWMRAAGDAECSGPSSRRSSFVCGRPYRDHPVVPGVEWLRRLCDGRLVKL